MKTGQSDLNLVNRFLKKGLICINYLQTLLSDVWDLNCKLIMSIFMFILSTQQFKEVENFSYVLLGVSAVSTSDLTV
jgi:hypothetical protein